MNYDRIFICRHLFFETFQNSHTISIDIPPTFRASDFESANNFSRERYILVVQLFSFAQHTREDIERFRTFIGNNAHNNLDMSTGGDL